MQNIFLYQVKGRWEAGFNLYEQKNKSVCLS